VLCVITGAVVAEKKSVLGKMIYARARLRSSRKPGRRRAGNAEERITATEQKCATSSGQLDELFNAARGGAKASQDTADAGVNAT